MKKSRKTGTTEILKQLERWKPLTLTSIKNKVAAEFQLLIRLSYADNQGQVICCSCGKKGHYKTFHGGHWIGRANAMTLYDRQNVHPQCVRCNAYLGGNRDGYDRFMDRTYGKEAIKSLRQRASQTKVWTRPELAEMVINYRSEIKLHKERLNET